MSDEIKDIIIVICGGAIGGFIISVLYQYKKIRNAIKELNDR